jgi:predicted permease
MREWWAKVTAMFSRNRLDEELSAEIDAHLQMAVDANLDQGMTPQEAFEAARRSFGNRTLVRESAREAWIFRWIEALFQDVRYAWRSLAKSPGFTSVTLLSLTLGIGANTAIFSLINALMIRPVRGVDQPDRLVRLTNGDFSYPIFEELERRRLFTNTMAFMQTRIPAAVNGTTRWAQAELASGDYYAALGVPAMLGRTISPDDERTRAPVAVLSHAFWVRAFAADPGVLGRLIQINQLDLTVVGVTPPEFAGIVVGSPTDITVPVTLAPSLLPALGSDILNDRASYWLDLMGRLPPGRSLAQVDAQLQVTWPRVLALSAADRNRSSMLAEGTRLLPAGNGVSPLRGRYASPLYVLMGLVGLVLLIGCANVANLLLARGAARQREFAIRLATGAGRGRVIRQLLTESLLLATVAAAGGAVLAWAATGLLVRLISVDQAPVLLDLSADWRVLIFTIGVTTMTALLFGLAPASRAVRVDVASSLKAHTRVFDGAGTRLRGGLVIAQVALSMLLVVGAGLFINSLRQILAVDAGFDPTNVLLVRASATELGYRGQRTIQFYSALLDRLNRRPEIQSAALSLYPPVSRGGHSRSNISIEGIESPIGGSRLALRNIVSSRYFETIGQKLVHGRTFTELDRHGAPNVAVINESLVHAFFGTDNPVGRKFDPRGGRQFDWEIVGVVRDASYTSLKDPPKPVFYVPYEQGSDLFPFLKGRDMFVEVRSRAAGTLPGREVRQTIAQLDARVMVETEPLETFVAGSLAQERLLALLSGFLGAISLLLVAIGLYGVMAYSVTRRTGEIGIRMALGAPPAAVLSMIFREGLLLVLAGVIMGGALARASSHLVASLLFGITARDAAAFAGAVGVMALATLVATLLPARRAARVDPIVALRHE